MDATRPQRDYALVTAAYWAFTLSDGALRMLVLLHLHERGFLPLEIAGLFLSYELFGVVTNATGGWIASRTGLKSTLTGGLALQVLACGLLALLGGAGRWALPLLLVAQALSGVAKDLTKMSAKSYIKLVVPEGDPRGLLRWVSLLTGSKNALKGVGFFLGGLLLSAFGFTGACLLLAGTVGGTGLAAQRLLPRAAGKSRRPPRLADLFGGGRAVRWLSAARLFLFGARDVWFVLALPVFLATDLGWNHATVGGALALWIVGYGIVQALAPTFLGLRRRSEGGATDASVLPLWTSSLLLPLGALILALLFHLPPALALLAGLGAFGVLFAANSALHSYLIVAYAERESVALRVGFYYTANASGRFLGTLLSGLVFQLAGGGRIGLVACLAVSLVFVVLAAALSLPLVDRRRGATTA